MRKSKSKDSSAGRFASVRAHAALAFGLHAVLALAVVAAFVFAPDVSLAHEPASISPAPPLKASTALRRSNVIDKNGIIARLQQIKTRTTQEIDALESASKRRLQESTTLSLRGNADLALAESRALRIKEELTSLEARRSELYARRVLMDRLIFVADTKWNGQALATFLEHQFLDMATQELTGPGAAGQLWQFMVYASVVAREIPETNSDVLAVLDGYIRFASVLNPKTPAEFQASRDYSNESESVRARITSKDKIGDGLEQKLSELEGRINDQSSKSKSKTASQPNVRRSNIELNIRGLPTPPATPATTVTSTNDEGSTTSGSTQSPSINNDSSETSKEVGPNAEPQAAPTAPAPASPAT